MSATASETERNASHLLRFIQRADDAQFEHTSSASAATSLHSCQVSRSRSTDSSSHLAQSVTATDSLCSSLTASASVVNYRYLPAISSSPAHTAAPADVSDLLFDDQSLLQLPPPLIPIPDRYQPLVDIEISESVEIENMSNVSSDTLVHQCHAAVQPRSPKSGECSVCMECEPNAALYPCGHMSMCYDCAVSVQKLRGALCPICRQPIIDILRIYRT